MEYKDFEDFLMEKCMQENPQWLDDCYPDAYVGWSSELSVEELIAYADKYAKKIVAELTKK